MILNEAALFDRLKNTLILLVALYISGAIAMLVFGLFEDLSLIEIIVYPMLFSIAEILLEPFFKKTFSLKAFKELDKLSFFPKVTIISIGLLLLTVIIIFIAVRH